MDNMATGILFRYVRLAKGDALVFAQNQKGLLENSDKWAKMMKPGDVVISNLSYTGTAKQQEKMIKILKSFHPVKISHSEWGPTVVVVK